MNVGEYIQKEGASKCKEPNEQNAEEVKFIEGRRGVVNRIEIIPQVSKEREERDE
ncbi:unnamed protein product [Tenebrio molitor]|jgi:hypothetical protein|nr:unnamed protein product [Tenebrio molitor]